MKILFHMRQNISKAVKIWSEEHSMPIGITKLLFSTFKRSNWDYINPKNFGSSLTSAFTYTSKTNVRASRKVNELKKTRRAKARPFYLCLTGYIYSTYASAETPRGGREEPAWMGTISASAELVKRSLTPADRALTRAGHSRDANLSPAEWVGFAHLHILCCALYCWARAPEADGFHERERSCFAISDIYLG